MDFEGFFPSFKEKDFVAFAYQNLNGRIGNEDIKYLSKLFFRKAPGLKELVLSIGAPSSPTLSNRMMQPIDVQIQSLCEEYGVIYTRYADDLAFSTNQPNTLFGVKKGVDEVIQETKTPNLKINDQKTVWTSRKHKKMVTGLILTPDKRLSVGRERKRRVRAGVHHFAHGQLSAPEVQRLRGELAFVGGIEPDFLVKLREKFGDSTIEKIQRYEPETSSDEQP